MADRRHEPSSTTHRASPSDRPASSSWPTPETSEAAEYAEKDGQAGDRAYQPAVPGRECLDDGASRFGRKLAERGEGNDVDSQRGAEPENACQDMQPLQCD